MERKDKNSDRISSPGSGKVFAGLILVGIGAVLLGREMGMDIPTWLLTWETFIIALGVFFGARRNFRAGGWMIMIAVGVAFLLNDNSDFGFHNYIWPIAIILFGLWMIMKPRRNRSEWKMSEGVVDDNTIDINTVFGGTKKKIMSKEFKGGEINTVFGGNDIDFTQADLNGTATLEINIVFGGAKLIVPAHWKIQTEVDAVFGSVEDKRRDTNQVAENKTLVLKGSVVFGSIEIKSY